MSPKHIAIARQEVTVEGRTGPRAAFDFYMGQKVPTAHTRQERIRSAGNKKAQFTAYCTEFGSLWAGAPISGNGVVHSESQKESLIEKLANRLNGNRDNGVQAFVEKDEPTVDPIVQGLADKLGVSVEKLAEIALTSDDSAVEAPVAVTPAPVVKRTVPVATRISYKMAMSLLRICNKHNVVFEITGKTGGGDTGQPADYSIKIDGLPISATEASTLIAANKA